MKNDEGKYVAIIVELKQWSKVEIVSEKDGIVRTFVGGDNREVAHPSYQAWSYAAYIEDYNESVQKEKVNLYPCAYLHNYEPEEPKTVLSEKYLEYIKKAPIFVSGDVYKLRNFINQYVKYGDDKDTLYIIENGKTK